MSLDPERAARVRRLVLDRSTWPGGVLRMKRVEDGVAIVEFGMIVEAEPDWIAIAVDDPVIGVRTFANIEQLIAAGWAVEAQAKKTAPNVHSVAVLDVARAWVFAAGGGFGLRAWVACWPSAIMA
jgi:hypothetical protein